MGIPPTKYQGLNAIHALVIQVLMWSRDQKSAIFVDCAANNAVPNLGPVSLDARSRGLLPHAKTPFYPPRTYRSKSQKTDSMTSQSRDHDVIGHVTSQPQASHTM